MKKSKIVAMVLCLVLCLSLFAVSAFAESAEQDGVKLTLVTDKAEYAVDEQIIANLKIENNSANPVKNVTLKIEAPGALILAAGTEEKTVAELAAGVSDSVEAAYQVDVPDKTGDSTPVFGLIAAAVVSCAVIVLMFINRRTVCMALALVILVGLVVVGLPVRAEAASYDLETVAAIQVGGEELTLRGVASYEQDEAEQPDELAQLQAAVVELAWDYFVKGSKIQYCSQEVSSIFNKYYGGTYRLTEDASPEDGTSHTTIYSVCSDWTYKVYYEALGYRMFDSPNYLDAVTTAYWEFCERDGALVLRWKNDNYKLTAADLAYGTFSEESLQTTLDEAIAFMTNWEENLQPGDILLPYGHAMLYVGNGYVLDCWGSKYNNVNGVESFEDQGGVSVLHTVEGVFLDGTDPVTKSGYQLKEGTSLNYFAVIRPLNMDRDFTVTEAAASRVEYPAMEIDRTVSITPYGTAYTGQTLTYTVAISNETTNASYLTFRQAENAAYAGENYQDLVVTEKIPAGTTLVEGSISNGGEYRDGVITWNIDIAAGSTAALTYDVVVTAQPGQTIVSNGGYVENIPSNTIENLVGEAKLSADALAGLTTFANTDPAQWRDTYNVSALTSDLDFAERVYAKAMGIAIDLPTISEMLTNVFKTQYVKNEVGSIRFEPGAYDEGYPYVLQTQVDAAYQDVRDMLIPGYYGGMKAEFENNGDSINEFHMDYLEPGDILVYAKTGNDENIQSTEVMVYAGDGTLLKITSDQKTSVLTGSKATAAIWKALAYDVFFALRPSQAIADISDQKYDPANEPTYGTEPGQEEEVLGQYDLSDENKNKLLALASEELSQWKKFNTNFADEVYGKLDIDLGIGGSTVATILKQIFTDSGDGDRAYTLKTEEPGGYENIYRMLVKNLRGGRCMVDDGTFSSSLTAADLEPGDVLCLAVRKNSIYWVGVYLGEGKILMSRYYKSGVGDIPAGTTYAVMDVDTANMLETDPLSGIQWESWFLLRPYQAFVNINGDGAEEETGNYVPLSNANKDKLLALDTTGWTKSNTAFSQQVYEAIGIDIGIGGYSSATLLKALFIDNHGTGTYDFQYSLNPDEPGGYEIPYRMLVKEFRGGKCMVNDGTFSSNLTAADLDAGDILFLSLREKSVYWVGVYLGEGKLLMGEYYKYDTGEIPAGTKYEILDFDNANILTTDPYTGLTWESWFILRPWQGIENINGDEVVEEDPPTTGSMPLNDTNKAELLALAGNTSWQSGNHIAFAANIYKAIGLDLDTALMSGQSTATVTTKLFSANKSSPYGYTLKAETAVSSDYAAMYQMLLAGFYGGSDTTGTDILASQTLDQLAAGDILMLSYRKAGTYWVGVYLGEGKLAMSKYYTTSGAAALGLGDSSVLQYEVMDVSGADAFAKLLKQNPDMETEYLWENYFVLRPYQAYTDINSEAAAAT